MIRLRVRQIAVPLDYTDTDVLRRVSRTLGCSPALLSDLTVIKRSLDTRQRNPEPCYIMSVNVTLKLDRLPRKAKRVYISFLDDPPKKKYPTLGRTPERRPVVVGAGPAGLMAAYELAMSGARPLLIERGQPTEKRNPAVNKFWKDGTLDPENNVLYGEGGAGLFSDGKLTARSKERGLIEHFLQTLVDCGAPKEILMDAEPHVGTDSLQLVVPRMRRTIEQRGGEVRFGARLQRLVIENGRLRAVVVNGEEIACDHCILAVGHSARDVYAMVADLDVALEAKPFAVGVRLELPQAQIDRAQYGRFAQSPQLGAASFRLTRRAEHGLRACYSFCMCPGGRVITCASEPGYVTTNGMSYAARSLKMGNAAFIVPVGPEDFPDVAVPALAGIEFQRHWEQEAFRVGGETYSVPACRLIDFLSGRVGELPAGMSCNQVRAAELRRVLPDIVSETLTGALLRMLKELNGTKPGDAVLYATESRSSSPVRIVRNDDGVAIKTEGLYPAGEGAGYAGGIVSSGVDGLKAAQACLKILAQH